MAKNLPTVPSGKAGSMAESLSGLTWREQYPVISAGCTSCLECTLFCPEGALFEGENTVSVQLQLCKGCGICAVECKEKAITMIPEFSRHRGIFPAKGAKR